MKGLINGLVGFGLALLLGCSVEPDPKPETPVRLQLKWYHQAQFAGFYAADQRGLYADAGLKVNFLEGGKDVAELEVLKRGEAEFAISSAEAVVKAAAQGADLVAVAAIFQRNPMVFLVRKDDSIRSPQDFAGRRINFPGGQGKVMYQAVAKAVGLDPAQVEERPYDYSFGALRNGEVDISASYIIGGYLRALQNGFETRAVWPDEYGVRFYGDVLVVRKQWLEQNQSLARTFVQASLEGWRQALQDPGKSIEEVMRLAKDKNVQYQTAMFNHTVPLIVKDDIPIGMLAPARWKTIEVALLEAGVIEALPVEHALRLDLVKAP